jgi:hypothetical protein
LYSLVRPKRVPLSMLPAQTAYYHTQVTSNNV